MARKKETTLYREPMAKLAGMIAAALEACQHADGTTKHWTDEKFGLACGVSPEAVKDWRTGVSRPTTRTGKILEAFYGTNHAYAEQRAALYQALIDAGCEDIDPPEPGHIPLAAQFSDIVKVVSLLINREEVNNKYGTIDVPFTLRFLRANNVEVRFKYNGKIVTRMVDLWLEKPLFMVSSDHWQPLQTSFFRKAANSTEQNNQHYRLSDDEEDCVEIVGPMLEGRIVGDPFEGELTVTMESRGPSAGGQIKFTVEVPPEGLRVAVHGERLAPKQQDVINAIVASKTIPRGKRKRIVVATGALIPGIKKGEE
jgi:hypothetical protein